MRCATMKEKPPSPAARQMLNLGIIGYGRLARDYYAPALARMKGVTVAAVTDPLEQSRLAAAAWRPLARVYDDQQHMLAQEKLDAVLIVSPPSSHLKAWLAARAHGLPAFVEKPFGLASQLGTLPNLSDADAALMVDFNRRFWPPFRQMIEAARSGAIGSLREIEFTLHADMARWSAVTSHRLQRGGRRRSFTTWEVMPSISCARLLVASQSGLQPASPASAWKLTACNWSWISPEGSWRGVILPMARRAASRSP